MQRQIATEEYTLALKQGQKEVREAGRNSHPLVLDEILGDDSGCSVQELGLLEIPVERIVGVKSAGRISAFSPTFLPLLGPDTEFARKWISLCVDHLGNTGIRDPIECFEYLGNFYVQEGNKRVSVLRHFGAARITGNVRRILPVRSEEPRIKAYYEFLEFYKKAGIYAVQFRRPGDYNRLLSFLNISAQEVWSEDQRRTFRSYFHYFQEAFQAVKTAPADVLPEEALLVWLQLYPYTDLGRMTAAELKKSLSDLWGDVVTASTEAVNLHTKPRADGKSNLLNLLIHNPEHLNVAFVHQLRQADSSWVMRHEEGREYLERIFGDRITCRSYFEAKDVDAAGEIIDRAVAQGAQVVFTTAPLLRRAALRAAVKYPKVKFLNCSVDQPYSSIRSYYGRIYEAKFIAGAIAGAMAQDDRIGYIASYPIFGVPASINAFALGAQMTNPRAQIELRWSCCEGTPQADFFRDGIRVVSNRDMPTQNKMYMEFCNYGTYLLDDRGGLIPLASPVWVWGKFYEFAVKAMFSGTWKDQKGSIGAVNYWLGMDSGVIDIQFSDKLPAGVRSLAQLLKQNLSDGTLDPFRRKIRSQDGQVRNDGTGTLGVNELLRMDWLCENIIGEIPAFDRILPMSQPTVRELGIYRDSLAMGKEVAAGENSGNLR